MTDSQASEASSLKLRQIAARAADDKEVAFRSLAHLVDLGALRRAHGRVRKDGAAGVDGQTASAYGENLEGNLRALQERLKSKTYKPPPVRRAYIPKSGGKERPIGIPTFEDKIVQRAYATVMEAIYEQDFLDCSYGFRPGRGAHTALDALWRGCMNQRVSWVLDADIQGFFDALEHEHLREFIQRRITDGGVRRLVSKWLEAGVLEAGSVTRQETGTPQGGVISPLLANIYLHYVLDEWFHETVLRHLRGRAFLVRYADDFVIGFEHEDDALRVMAVLPKRFGRYGLTLHPDKTRLVPFSPPRQREKGTTEPGTFDFLGFTHYWKKSRKGKWVVARRTAKGRLTRSIRSLREWCRDNRHQPVVEQHRTLSRKLRGHYAYFGVTGNYWSLAAVWHETLRAWRKWLNRRSQRARMDWRRFYNLLERHPLPPPRVVHTVYRSATGRREARV